MAVPFHVPEASDPATSAATSSSSSTTSATSPQLQNPSGAAHNHSMPMNVVNNEYLVQALCEALYRYSRAGGTLTSPPSPSSACTTLYGNGEVYFNFNDLHNSHLDDIYGSPRRQRSHSLSIPTSTQSSRTIFSSRGHAMTDDEDDSNGENFSNPIYMDEHYNCMTLREQLQEFPGRVPQRKRKTTATVLGNPQQQKLHKPKEQKFAWSTIVALGMLAVGCGLLATR
ncbi:cell death protein hid [Chironomus tepperi]|uniref:cell death protein hid n=1 Tax=Chironomus tepperi TaxID=113505 RepID=UPI00391F47E4